MRKIKTVNPLSGRGLTVLILLSKIHLGEAEKGRRAQRVLYWVSCSHQRKRLSMPSYQVDIEKRLGEEYWTNVYYVFSDTLTDADAAAGEILAYEQNMHLDIVTFTKLRVRTQVEGDEVYISRPVAVNGERPTVGEYLPLFNVCRVDLGTTSGRPSRKFYRLPLLEGDQQNGQLVGSLVSIVDSNLQGLSLALEGLVSSWVDVDGQQIVAIAVFPDVGMRQLRRGSRRRTTPILP